MDSLYSSLIGAIDNFMREFFNYLKSSLKNSDATDYVILALLGFDLIICLIVDIIFSKYIASYEVKVMDTFLEVPRKYTLYLNGQCETYIAELQV